MGKWKTACQMISIALLLGAQQGGAGGLASLGAGAGEAAAAAGVPLLCVATGLTVWSLCEYFAGLWRFMV
jgi:CDP-diacylglycerol--glycerol-3-phosphate 3-phosphatidyltransferase